MISTKSLVLIKQVTPETHEDEYDLEVKQTLVGHIVEIKVSNNAPEWDPYKFYISYQNRLFYFQEHELEVLSEP